jgi:ABC-type sugar transport system substrate-binding protein
MRHHLRQWLPALLVVSLAAIFPLAKSIETTAKNYKIVLAPKSTNSVFFEGSRNGCMDAARRLGVTCLYEGPE